MKAVVLGLVNPETNEPIELTVEKINNSVVILQLKQSRLPTLRAEIHVKELVQTLSFLTDKSVVHLG